jgi:hypothetical protein
VFLSAVEAGGQTNTTTTCQAYTPYSVDCQSHTSADLSAQIRAQNKATARGWSDFFAALQARRDRNAAVAQLQSINAAERARQALADSRQTDRDDAARSAEDAAKAADEARTKARLDLFNQRAEFIRSQALEKIPLIGIPLFDYKAETGAVLSKLFVANSLATNAEMKEALDPIDAKFAAQNAAFMERFQTAVTLTADQYKIPRRDFARFREAAWREGVELYRFDIQTSPLIMRDAVDLAARGFAKTPVPRRMP